jgi:DNA adenine methylase
MFNLFKSTPKRCKLGFHRKGDRCVRNIAKKPTNSPQSFNSCPIDGKHYCKDGDKPLKAPIAYLGGKSKLANKIIDKIPEHEVYVEPFIGGGSVYYKKPLAKKNVIGDKDKDIVKIHQTLKNNPNTIKSCDMTLSTDKFNRIKNKSDKSACNVFYLNKLSYGAMMSSPVTCSNPKNKESCERRWKRNKDKGMKYQKVHVDDYKEKLKNTTILNQDYKAVMKKYDSPKTLHYLDPPYVVGGKSYKVHGVTPEEVCYT